MNWKVNDAVVPPEGYEVPQPSQFGNTLFIKMFLAKDWVELTTDPIHHSDCVGSFHTSILIPAGSYPPKKGMGPAVVSPRYVDQLNVLHDVVPPAILAKVQGQPLTEFKPLPTQPYMEGSIMAPRDFLEEKAEEPKKEGLDYYGGFATLEEMITAFGKSKTRDWCFITAYKYMSRIGKKPGAEINSDAQKAKDYIVLGMRLTRELEEN